MRIGIDPAIDCVFKALFGSEENKQLLIALVNAIMEESGREKIVEVEILNPYNPKTFLRDKLSVVDIKAKTEWENLGISDRGYARTDLSTICFPV